MAPPCWAKGRVVGYRDALARAGIEAEIGEGLCVGINFHLADSKERAVKEATPFSRRARQDVRAARFLPWAQPTSSSRPWRNAATGDRVGFPTIDAQMGSRAWFCGTGDEMIEYLKGLEEQFPGLETINVQSSMGTPESVMIEQLDRFAAEVMPASRANRQ